jgi:hypothetical protein
MICTVKHCLEGIGTSNYPVAPFICQRQIPFLKREDFHDENFRAKDLRRSVCARLSQNVAKLNCAKMPL